MLKNKLVIKADQLNCFLKCIDYISMKKHLSKRGLREIMLLWKSNHIGLNVPETEDNTP